MKQNNYGGGSQKPIGSGFHAASTASEVIEGIDLAGKISIVTGGSAGIGLETTKMLAAAGARVLVPARDLDKARRNLAAIPNVEIEPLNLMDGEAIDAFASRFLASGRPLHLLINNAGIMWVPLRRDARGNESQLATNYLSQFHLTARLWPALRKANGARVINLSSAGHQFGRFHFEDPNFLSRDYETLQAYGQSKTATNLFTVELDARACGYNVRAFAVQPGAIGGTELGREAPKELLHQLGFCDQDGNIYPSVAASLKTIPQGAATTIWCATSPVLGDMGGVYCEDVEVAVPADEKPGIVHSSGVYRSSLDETAAKRLWQWSEETTGIVFTMD